MMAHALTAPRERPILFSGPMVRAILEGRKCQTRRLAKFKPLEAGLSLGFSGLSAGHFRTGVPSSGSVLYSRGRGGVWQQRTAPLHCPYGAPGDRLWCKETWGPCAGGVVYRADSLTGCPDGGRWKPAIHMPRWASRLTLEVTDVRLERLQDISEEDIRAEGIDSLVACTMLGGRGASGAALRRIGCGDLYDRKPNTMDWSPRDCWQVAWDSINGKRAPWESNPWVWVVGFRRLKP